MSVPNTLEELRSTTRQRWLATAVAVVVGIGLGWMHWFGVYVGAALVALVQRTVGRGIAAGIGFGMLFVGVFLVSLAMTGDLDTFRAMSRVSIVAVGGVVLAAVFGSFVRGIR